MLTSTLSIAGHMPALPIFCNETDFLFGLSCSRFNRLIRFEQVEELTHYPDFREQHIEHEGWYFIPAYHYYYLPFKNSIKLKVLSFADEACDLAVCQLFWRLRYKACKFIPAVVDMNADTLAFTNAIFSNVVGGLMSLFEASTPSPRELDKARAFQHVLFNRTQLSSKTSLSDLARSSAISERDLRRVCEGVFGMSPHCIVNFHLLNHVAATIVKHPELSFQDVALKFGFDHESGFTRFFKKGWQCTPSSFRKTFQRIR